MNNMWRARKSGVVFLSLIWRFRIDDYSFMLSCRSFLANKINCNQIIFLLSNHCNIPTKCPFLNHFSNIHL